MAEDEADTRASLAEPTPKRGYLFNGVLKKVQFTN